MSTEGTLSGKPPVHAAGHADYGGSDDLAVVRHADDELLAQLGYKSEFRREFSVRALCKTPPMETSMTMHLQCAVACRDHRIRVFYHGRRRVRVFDHVVPACLRYVGQHISRPLC